jgi:hypothetical protein
MKKRSTAKKNGLPPGQPVKKESQDEKWMRILIASVRLDVSNRETLHMHLVLCPADKCKKFS